MAVDVLPRLKMVTDEDGIEADFLGKTRKAQQLARRELLRRRLVSELDHQKSPRSRRSGSMAPVLEIYRLAGNEQPATARRRLCISDLPCPSATSAAAALSYVNSPSSPRPKVTMG